MKLKEVSIDTYISAYISEKKPEWWESINEELNNVLPSSTYDIILNLYKRELIINVQKTLNIMSRKNEARLDIELQRILLQIKALKDRNSEDKMLTEADFIFWVVSVSKFVGYHIDKKQTSMLELAVATKQMNDEHKIIMQQMQQNKNLRRK